MAKYKATKNLFFKSLNKDVIVGEIVEFEKEYADKVNADLANVFPDTELVLEPLEKEVVEEPKQEKVVEESEEQEEKPKRTRKKAKADAETEK
ncbi:hypothetical protein [Streptococcus gallolyticus]|uniref:hypothetical protein n=1 Tax=Streptococcus gallolyticus TaxID=315405 RepID=UPI0022832F62|nr:hypothetical protein [Streptococcus gallolyticus]MCY7156261.1 hypothetical protein [Streptococcus gallolyticus subsp. gallolyticus]